MIEKNPKTTEKEVDINGFEDDVTDEEVTEESTDNDIYYKDLIRLVAMESGFTIKDSRKFMKALQSVIYKLVQAKKKVFFSNVFIMEVKKSVVKRRWDGIHKIWNENPLPTYRLLFRASPILTSLVRTGGVIRRMKGLEYLEDGNKEQF